MIALVIGGSGSGKSAWAEQLACSLPGTARIYLATMQVWDDEESRRRVARHRAMRAGKGFTTVECPKNLASADIPDGACVLLEGLPNLVANEMFDGGDPKKVVPDLTALMRKCSSLVIVTDQVFSDGITYDESTTAYLRSLAEAANSAAESADLVAEVVCGIPIAMKGAIPCGL